MPTTSGHLSNILGIDRALTEGECAGQWEAFFPEDSNPYDVKYRYKAAKEICADCRIRTQCLAGALERNEEYGVWGGTSPTDRERMKRLQNRRR